MYPTIQFICSRFKYLGMNISEYKKNKKKKRK